MRRYSRSAHLHWSKSRSAVIILRCLVSWTLGERRATEGHKPYYEFAAEKVSFACNTVSYHQHFPAEPVPSHYTILPLRQGDVHNQKCFFLKIQLPEHCQITMINCDYTRAPLVGRQALCADASSCYEHRPLVLIEHGTETRQPVSYAMQSIVLLRGS